MKPFHDIDLATRTIILSLCAMPDLGNVSFQHYPTPGHNDTITFSMDQTRTGWGLVVSSELSGTRDIYKVFGDRIIFSYSERD